MTNVWTAGVGHTKTVTPTTSLTSQQIKAHYVQDISAAEKMLTSI
ncbi:glycoside hydrolase family protein [Vibrio diabolicus]